MYTASGSKFYISSNYSDVSSSSLAWYLYTFNSIITLYESWPVRILSVLGFCPVGISACRNFGRVVIFAFRDFSRVGISAVSGYWLVGISAVLGFRAVGILACRQFGCRDYIWNPFLLLIYQMQKVLHLFGTESCHLQLSYTSDNKYFSQTLGKHVTLFYKNVTFKILWC